VPGKGTGRSGQPGRGVEKTAEKPGKGRRGGTAQEHRKTKKEREKLSGSMDEGGKLRRAGGKRGQNKRN